MHLPIIQDHKDLQQAVSARELYNFLAPSERFSSWFERQLQYGFIDGQDYLGCEVFNALARQMLADFLVSVDMAKEISMIQRSDKGRQARQYFISCERQAQSNTPAFQIPTTLSEALRLAADQADVIEHQQTRLAIAEPKAAALDVIDSAVGDINVRDTAKTLGIPQTKFINWCLAHNWLYRDNAKKLQMHSQRMKQGFMKQRPATFLGSNGEIRVNMQPLFTPKGLTHLAGIFAIVHEVA
ncbi:phage antirepressor KilAC domain-containing protein [Psychrobacter sp. 16-MNA-CIBAN-0192]|uniref:phage antirepressor KilAC domain-containing protein n=1 Tax=Psychrobacter sp. 16-MNA-CIBAN-0192 TaxID=3140448 RepID=UPI00331DC7EB